MRILWSKIRQAITLERVIYIAMMVFVAVLSFTIGYSAPRYVPDDSDWEKVTISSTKTSKTTSSTIGQQAGTTTSGTNSIVNGKVAINYASKEQLMSLPGIGETFAQRIIDYRTTNNGFADISELKNIKGISDGRYNKWKDYFIIN